MPHRVLIPPLSLTLPPFLSSWLSRLISHQVQLDRAPSSVCSLHSVLLLSEPRLSSSLSFIFIFRFALLTPSPSLQWHSEAGTARVLFSSLPPLHTTSVLLHLSIHMNNKVQSMRFWETGNDVPYFKLNMGIRERIRQRLFIFCLCIIHAIS